jgi:cell division protease FtsH
VFNDVTTGASNDIKRATQIAEAMVCDVGMSDALGLRNYGKKQEEIFLGREIAQHRDFSEKTAELIDSEINRILEEARQETAALLEANRDKLELLAQALLIHEILDTEEIDRVLLGETLALAVRPDEQIASAESPALPVTTDEVSSVEGASVEEPGVA